MKKALVIEDEVNLRETLCDLLELNHYDVIMAKNGNEGIEKAKSQTPDLILCDINMPYKDGYEVLRELRTTDILTLVPFIFITAKSAMEELRTGMELGADDYLIKPFTHDSLIRAIRVAEEKKLTLINQLGDLQNQLNMERLRLKNIDRLNSHEIRSKLSIIQSLFPLIKSGEMDLQEGLSLMEKSGEAIEEAVRHVNQLVSEKARSSPFFQNHQLGDKAVIWLVDDDATQNLLTRMQLRKINPDWQVEAFQDPMRALEMLDAKLPDLIFLDINMPKMNGFEFLEELSGRSTNHRVVMLSSSISQEDITRSLSYPQVVNYFTKPLKKERIEEYFLPK